MTPIFAIKLGLAIQKTHIGKQKINCLAVIIYKIAVAIFYSKISLKKLNSLKYSYG